MKLRGLIEKNVFIILCKNVALLTVRVIYFYYDFSFKIQEMLLKYRFIPV